MAQVDSEREVDRDLFEGESHNSLTSTDEDDRPNAEIAAAMRGIHEENSGDRSVISRPFSAEVLSVGPK